MAVLPTGSDVTINGMLKGRAGHGDSIHMAAAMLGMHRRGTMPHAVHRLGGGQQQCGPTSDSEHERRRAVGMACGLHACLVSRGAMAVRASAERRRVLLA